jgi:hypothetical protein
MTVGEWTVLVAVIIGVSWFIAKSQVWGDDEDA